MDNAIVDAQEAFADAAAARRAKPENAERVLEAAREAFEEAVEAERDNRTAAAEDLRFARLGEQWPDKVRKDREQANRPCLTINKLPAFTRQVVNDARQNRPSISVRPVDSSGDPATAEVFNGLIRNIEYSSNADVAYDTAMASAVDCGFGYFRINAEYAHDDAFDLDLRIARIANPFSVYGDPASDAADSAEWDVAFVTSFISLPKFKLRYPDAEASSWDVQDMWRLGAAWRDGDDLLLAEYWQRESVPGLLLQLSTGAVMDAKTYAVQRPLFEMMGWTVTGTRDTQRKKVTQRIISGSEVLSKTEWPGRFIPLIPVYGDEVNVEGKRHLRSLIRDAKDPQRMFNYWRTTTTELVAMAPKAPWVGPKGFAKSSPDKWKTADRELHAYLEYDGAIAPQRQPFDGPPPGAMQEAMNASDDMKAVMGLYDASLGARSNETSGVAIVARQREGDVSNFHFVDNLSRAIRHAGRVLIDLIPHVYSGARVVRVLGPDGKARNVPVNQPTQLPDGTAAIYDLAVGKYDLAVEAGPSFTTKRQEAAAQMMELLKVMPAAAPLISDLLVKHLDWPGADEIAQRLQAMLPPQLQGQGDPRLQQAQQQLQQLQQQLQFLQAENQRLKDGYTIKQQDANTKAFSAETDRLEAMAPVMNPAQIQALVLQTMQQVLGSPDVLPMPRQGQMMNGPQFPQPAPGGAP